MSLSGKAELQNLIPQVWSSLMFDELRNNLMLGSILEKKYSGEIRQMGDVVRVNQIVAPEGQILTDDKQTFDTEAMNVQQFQVTADKRAHAGYEITDLADLQSMSFQQEAREALVYAVAKKVEETIIAEMLTNATDLGTPTVASDLDTVDIANARKQLTKNLVPNSPRWALLDPEYYSDILQKNNFISSDFIPGQSPVSSGAFRSPLYGFTVAEHDLLDPDKGLFFHPSAVQLVMQQDLRIKLSDNHVNGRYGYILTADLVFGLKTFESTRMVKYEG